MNTKWLLSETLKKYTFLLPADTPALQGKWLGKKGQGWTSVPICPLSLVGAPWTAYVEAMYLRQHANFEKKSFLMKNFKPIRSRWNKKNKINIQYTKYPSSTIFSSELILPIILLFIFYLSHLFFVFMFPLNCLPYDYVNIFLIPLQFIYWPFSNSPFTLLFLLYFLYWLNIHH